MSIEFITVVKSIKISENNKLQTYLEVDKDFDPKQFRGITNLAISKDTFFKLEACNGTLSVSLRVKTIECVGIDKYLVLLESPRSFNSINCSLLLEVMNEIKTGKSSLTIVDDENEVRKIKNQLCQL